jgi:hypothetical protein
MFSVTSSINKKCRHPSFSPLPCRSTPDQHLNHSLPDVNVKRMFVGAEAGCDSHLHRTGSGFLRLSHAGTTGSIKDHSATQLEQNRQPYATMCISHYHYYFLLALPFHTTTSLKMAEEKVICCHRGTTLHYILQTYPCRSELL